MKMPEALHCMFFTNAYLNRIRCGGTNKIDTTHMKELFSYLLNDLKYSYIVVDIQADNEIGQFFLANADTFADKLLITCTQDPHSIVTAGMLLNDLRSEYKSDVIDNSRIIINRFSSTSPVTIPKIAKWLKLPPKKFYKISEDRDGYQKAEMNAIPYVVGKGQYFKEYMTLGVVF